MKVLFNVVIIAMMVKTIRSTTGCKLEGNMQVCRNVNLIQGKPIELVGDIIKIETIDFNDCKLPTIPTGVFTNFKQVSRIWLDGMEVEFIEPKAFESMSNLKNLHLESNNIKELKDDTFSGLEHHLTFLNLGNNKISDKSLKTIKLLTKLTSLHLINNAIEKLHPFFDSFIDLEVLDLQFNKITEVNGFEKNTKITELHLNDNHIREIKWSSVYWLTKLKILNLHNNKISKIDSHALHSLKNLKVLRLDNNQIETINLETFRFLFNLETLRIESNSIKYFKLGVFNSLINLQELYLSSNEIEELELGVFSSLTKLQKLYLDHNKMNTLTRFCFSSLTSLEELRLEHNKLKALPEYIFDSLVNLKTLHLSNNELASIPAQCVRGPNALQELYLDHNNIESLDAVNLLCHHQNLLNITLNNNAWNCPTLSTIVKELVDNNVQITDNSTLITDTNVYGITCKSAPEDDKDRDLKSEWEMIA